MGWINPKKVDSSLFNEPISQSETDDDVYMLLDNPGDNHRLVDLEEADNNDIPAQITKKVDIDMNYLQSG